MLAKNQKEMVLMSLNGYIKSARKACIEFIFKGKTYLFKNNGQVMKKSFYKGRAIYQRITKVNAELVQVVSWLKRQSNAV